MICVAVQIRATKQLHHKMEKRVVLWHISTRILSQKLKSFVYDVEQDVLKQSWKESVHWVIAYIWLLCLWGSFLSSIVIDGSWQKALAIER